jgi:hypothetical protein
MLIGLLLTVAFRVFLDFCFFIVGAYAASLG